MENTYHHGLTATPEYRAWASMKSRCSYKKGKSFKYYGGRGIKVCARWQDSFLSFLADMGPRPSPTHSLDRIDNDGDYTPHNCKWSTKQEQIKNRRNMVPIKYHAKAVAGLALAISTAGDGGKLGAICGVTRQAIHIWNVVPVYHVAAIAKALGIKPKKLRPDIFT